MASIISKPNHLTVEQQLIRRNLKLRFNNDFNSWEVFTTKHGSDSRNMIFRWYLITADGARWYQQNFPDITILEPVGDVMVDDTTERVTMTIAA
jgi:hypothetical protein